MNNYTFDPVSVGKIIKKEMKNANLYQKELSAIANVSRWTVQDWIYGKKFHSIEKMACLCNTFDCDMDYLLGKQSCKRKEISTVHDITGLSEKAIEKLRFEHDKILEQCESPSNMSDLILKRKMKELNLDFLNSFIESDSLDTLQVKMLKLLSSPNTNQTPISGDYDAYLYAMQKTFTNFVEEYYKSKKKIPKGRFSQLIDIENVKVNENGDWKYK